MRWTGCSSLDEVRHALFQGHWPAGCAAELREHVEGCSRCSQEILVTQHFRLARTEAMEAARPGVASLLWWRAQVRWRNTVLERAERPVVAAQLFALVIIVAGIVGAIASHWYNLLEHALAVRNAPEWSLTALRGEWGLAPLVLALGLVAMLGGLVVYLTAERR
jgi:anti-sigma factor RsiW